MAVIGASPNPVGFYNPGTQTVFVEWDTEGPLAATVFVAVNGLIENKLPGQGRNGAARGRLPLDVTFPNFYYLSLKRADNLLEMAHAVVDTFDLRQQLAEGFASAYVPQLRPQMITNLVVKPGVDTVVISFRTTRPTIPTTELRDGSGAWVDGRLPLFAGLQTVHQAKFGVDKALALDTKHTFKIEAFGPTNNKQSPNKAVVTGEFATGLRSADVMFEVLNVHDDGDPGLRGKGEFVFSFGGGDAATRALIGAPVFWPDTGKVDISHDDPPVDLGKTLPMPSAPRRLWLQAIGTEYDRTIWPWEAGVGLGLRPSFDEPGTSYHGTGAAQQSDVTSIVDLGSMPGRRMIPFEMKTGRFDVDYTVTGHISVNAIIGSVISPRIFHAGRVSKSSAFLTEPGGVSRLAVPGVGERAELVALGADGALYHRSAARELPAQTEGSGWTRIELPGQGAPVVVASTPGMLDVIDLNADGSVLHCGYNTFKSRSGKWRKLGGRFREVHPAVSTGKRGADANVVLFGVADDGSLHVRDAYVEGQNWDRLGDHPIRAVAAVSAPGVGASLFAVSHEGTLLHHSRRNGRWRADVLNARASGESPTRLLMAVVMDQAGGKESKRARRDVIVGAMSEDHRVRILRWPDYPDGAPETRWKEIGSVQDLLAEDAKVGAAKTRRESRSEGAVKSRVSSSG